MALEELDRLDRQDVAYVYYRAGSNDEDLGALEMSVDEELTWATGVYPTTAPNQTGTPLTDFTRFLLAGHRATVPVGAIAMVSGRNSLVTRLVDNPEITTSRRTVVSSPLD